MDKKKKIAIVIIVIIGIIALGVSVGDNNPEIRGNYQVIEGMRLRANIEAIEEGYEVELRDPENVSVGSSKVTSDNVSRRFIGVVQSTVEIPMAETGTNPIPGDYIVLVRDPDGNEVFEDELTFDGPEIEITDVEISTEVEDEGWNIESIEAEVENDGDLSILAEGMKLKLNDRTEEIELEEEVELIPEESVQLEKEDLSIEVEEGEISVTLEVLSFEDYYGSYESEIVVGE